jgi:predicted transcriptional regulator
MSKVVTARIKDEVLADIDRIAEMRDRSRAWVLSRMIEKSVERELEFRAFIQEGIDAIERGDYYTQEEMEEWVEGLKQSRKKVA